ncbi:hypothetical protein HID58_073674, partial [Brassica napus]
KICITAQVPYVKTERHQTEKESSLGLAKLSRKQKRKGKMYPEDDQAQCNEEPSKLESQRSSAIKQRTTNLLRWLPPRGQHLNLQCLLLRTFLLYLLEQKGKGKMYPEDDQAQCNEEPSKLESQRSS